MKYLIVLTVLCCGCSKAVPAANPAPPPPSRITCLDSKQIGWTVVSLVEVDGKKFVVAKGSDCVSIVPYEHAIAEAAE